MKNEKAEMEIIKTETIRMEAIKNKRMEPETKKADTLKKKGRMQAKQMSLIGVMTAVLCIIGPFSIPIPFSPVPISFVNLVIYLAAYVLGAKAGTVSCLLYILLGLCGLPVLSGFSGGFGKLAGPTGGYLLMYPLLSWFTGISLRIFPGRPFFHAIGMILGLSVCYLCGTVWLAAQLGVGFAAALAVGVVPYLIGDALKIAAALFIGPKLRRGIRQTDIGLR